MRKVERRSPGTKTQTALAAVVTTAALSLADASILRHYYRVRGSAQALSLVATAGALRPEPGEGG